MPKEPLVATATTEQPSPEDILRERWRLYGYQKKDEQDASKEEPAVPLCPWPEIKGFKAIYIDPNKSLQELADAISQLSHSIPSPLTYDWLKDNWKLTVSFWMRNNQALITSPEGPQDGWSITEYELLDPGLSPHRGEYRREIDKEFDMQSAVRMGLKAYLTLALDYATKTKGWLDIHGSTQLSTELAGVPMHVGFSVSGNFHARQMPVIEGTRTPGDAKFEHIGVRSLRLPPGIVLPAQQ